MWLRFSSLILIIVAFCVSTTAARQVTLTDRDRAVIIRSVARDLFRPGRNYEGKQYIVADGIQPNWLPKIRGYEIVLRTRRHITNRWTGATGSDFRIKRDLAKLLGSAVARSTPPLCFFL
jgi:hypothetical protein